jgi:translin
MGIQNLDTLAERIHSSFMARTQQRDHALSQSRFLTRHAANAIRAVHRQEWDKAEEHLQQAQTLAESLKTELADYPDLYYTGYTQDALKELTEARVVFALVRGEPIPEPEDLGVVYATYLKGLAESVGELRRRCLDVLRDGYSKEVEVLLSNMDDIYAMLVTMDYPDAITFGLRRLTDIVRGITERTRGDITISLREQHLEQSLRSLEARLNDSLES